MENMTENKEEKKIHNTDTVNNNIIDNSAKTHKENKQKKTSTFRKWWQDNKSILIFVIVVMTVGIAIIAGFTTANLVYHSMSITWFGAGDWIALIVGTLGACATAILGYVAYWQNKKQRDDNEKTHKEQLDETKKNSILMSQEKYLDRLFALKKEFYEEHKIIIGNISDILTRVNALLEEEKVTGESISAIYTDFVIECKFFQNMANTIRANALCIDEKFDFMRCLFEIDVYFKHYTYNIFCPENQKINKEFLLSKQNKQNIVYDLFNEDMVEFHSKFNYYVGVVELKYNSSFFDNKNLEDLKLEMYNNFVRNENFYAKNNPISGIENVNSEIDKRIMNKIIADVHKISEDIQTEKLGNSWSSDSRCKIIANCAEVLNNINTLNSNMQQKKNGLTYDHDGKMDNIINSYVIIMNWNVS